MTNSCIFFILQHDRVRVIFQYALKILPKEECQVSAEIIFCNLWRLQFCTVNHYCKYHKESTVEPPVSDPPKCQACVVAYERWSFSRAETILGQNFASLAYGNCRDFPHVLNVLIIRKVNLEKKIRYLPLRNFHLLYQLSLLKWSWSLARVGLLREFPKIVI